MPFVNHVPLLMIFLPFVGALVTALTRKRQTARQVTLAVQWALVALAFALVASLWNSPQNAFNYSMGAFPAPWGNELRGGLLEAVLAFTFSAVMLLSVTGGASGLQADLADSKSYLYYVMLNLLTASMLAMVYTNDIFTAYVFIEINTVAACAIVAAKETGSTLRATIKYLIMSILGSGLFLLSVTILYSITGQLLMQPAHEAIQNLMATGAYHQPLIMTLALFGIAIAVKSALFPFHAWLPDAHSSTTTTSSSVLSSLVLKGYIVLLIKLLYRVYGLETAIELGILKALFFLGLAGMVAGSVMAFRQKDMKRMIAYSSVAQIGYIFMGIGLHTPIGIVAACYHIIAHAFTKSMLFLSAGSLSETADSKSIDGMTGAARGNPIAGLAFAVGAMSMIGVPLFAGFVSKFYLGMGALQGENGTLIAMVVLALSTFLNALYYVPALIKLYSKKKDQPVEQPVRKPFKTVTATILVLAVANVLLGIFYQPLLQALEAGLSYLG
jgi:multicomponent Na+:H+ antiporter subunit D